MAEPVHVAGPQHPWDEVAERARDTGHVVVHTSWGEWLTAALLDPELRALLGRDWPRYREAPTPPSRFVFAVSRLVVKHTAAAVLEVAPADLDIAYQPSGRPTLRGFGEDLQLSLAHTEELIVAAVSLNGPVGVDAEVSTREMSYELLRPQVCTEREANVLDALPEGERMARLLRLWTLKEAYTKALGQGMRRRFSAVGFHWDAEGHPVLDEDADFADDWSFATHCVHGRYLVSQAHHHTPSELRPTAAAVPTPPDAVAAERGREEPLRQVVAFPGRSGC
ncbi:4'-phosphopantetheinyl transferase family protein [Streptomyces mesophilus]|uniref:4'-phosphopantetheinyl transferase family protein n=1 Tax=Streptomyces mesophilus TaxID=1775132 RepID=UPI0033325739